MISLYAGISADVFNYQSPSYSYDALEYVYSFHLDPVISFCSVNDVLNFLIRIVLYQKLYLSLLSIKFDFLYIYLSVWNLYLPT